MAENWSTTAELFSKLFDKPKMTEKLLKKPPPKYVYDIIMNTMKVTGFPKGLFTAEEMDPKFFEKDPNNKKDILQKAIDITKVVVNENFEIKCTNILRGSEPDKTNYFLQKFYAAATNGKDNSKIISKYLEQKKRRDENEKKKKDEPPQQQQREPVQQPSKKMPPKGIIGENDGDGMDRQSNQDDRDFGNKESKLQKGTGMKIDTKIFMHNDILNEGKREPKATGAKIDLEAIKAHVEEISKHCNPIGKLIEFIGDDIELMNKELQNWIKESKSYKERFDEEIKKSDETLLPLQNELLELEDAIRDEQMQIKSIKSRLIKNEKIINNLITNVISFKNDGPN
jgi:TRAF3-interacting protein 1